MNNIRYESKKLKLKKMYKILIFKKWKCTKSLKIKLDYRITVKFCFFIEFSIYRNSFVIFLKLLISSSEHDFYFMFIFYNDYSRFILMMIFDSTLQKNSKNFNTTSINFFIDENLYRELKKWRNEILCNIIFIIHNVDSKYR